MNGRAGLSTRSLLVAAMLLVVTGVTASSLFVVRSRLEAQARERFTSDLAHSVEVFETLQAERSASLHRENALLADLPSLKALMTTRDRQTIADGAARFWTVSDNDLFALTSTEGTLLAAFTRGAEPSAEIRKNLESLITHGEKRFLLAGGRLFVCSARSLFFGPDETGSSLGSVVTGYEVNATLVNQLSRTSAADVAFVSRTGVVTSTLPPPLWVDLPRDPGLLAKSSETAATTMLGGQRYLFSSLDLSPTSTNPLRLVVLESFGPAERSRHELNQLLLFVAGAALLLGTLLMIAVSGWITGPLEVLTTSVRDYAPGARAIPSSAGGTREVRELSTAFSAMHHQIEEKSRALLEAERLATIGRMASSVSHDFRHYLAAVFANAEFLASSQLSQQEREELLNEIRTAVHGTTDLIDSLLVFSQSSGTAERSEVAISRLVERAAALVRAHPDAAGVHVQAVASGHDVDLRVEAKQMERAIYNLLLNACQAARNAETDPSVETKIVVSAERLDLFVIDNGAGVAREIRDSLFDPFVSRGKQNGTGLGLTMAHAVALEHGGGVTLLSSRPGQTIFVLSIARAGTEASSARRRSSLEILS